MLLERNFYTSFVKVILNLSPRIMSKNEILFKFLVK